MHIRLVFMLATFLLLPVTIMKSPRNCSIKMCLQAGQTHLSGCTGEVKNYATVYKVRLV